MSRIRHLSLAVWIALATSAVAQQPRPAQQQEQAKTFVAHLGAGRFEQAVEPFDQGMKQALPAAKLEEVWGCLTRQFGPLQKAYRARSEKNQQCEMVLVTCEFQRGRLDAKVVFAPNQRIVGLFFVPTGSSDPPPYADRTRFEEREIGIGKDAWRLPGTLSLPVGKGPFPGLVLVHGSGPHDRDETIGPNKPFRDLAQGLASAGIAVLRYEKRAKNQPATASLADLTVQEETVNDAVAAIDTLTSQDKIDPKRVFVLGHSLGGTLIPRIAKAQGKVAGWISLAGGTRPLEDALLEQTRYLMSLDGALSDQAREQLRDTERQVALIKALKPSPAASPGGCLLGASPKYWLDLQGYDPPAAAKAVDQPMLFLQGERDYQVTMTDLGNWRSALAARPDVTFRSYPKLNHLFFAGEGKSTPAEYTLPGHVAQAVVDDIAQWIHKQARSASGP